ncbi:MAG: alpha/beta fold hydrolase [Ardenticatenaceae bacterium]|nr:alpha/beta fold hydrolase [Ardenticatenaceae bacterium]
MTVGGLGLASTLGYLAVGTYVALQLTRPGRQAQSAAPADYGLPFDEVTVRSRDGLALAAWFIPAPDSDRAVLFVHGKDSCRSCEFQGRFVELAGRLQAEGFNILMIDLRGHGQSEGRYLTLGEHERWDVLGAVDWLQWRGFTKIGILGVSLGAASAVRAAADPQGGEVIRALALDSGFGNLRDALDRKFVEVSGLPYAFLPGSLLMGRLLHRVDFNMIRPAHDLPQIKAPVMLIFSEQDDLVPVSHFHAMAAARPDAEIWLLADAGHSTIYAAYPEEYISRVSRFLAQSLS